MRKPVMAGNWKMYKTAAETTAFFHKFVPAVAGTTHSEIVICPPFVNIPAAVEATRATPHSTVIGIGGQDLFWLQEGAYTGEISASMLTAAGCGWVIIGHSERRQYFGETDETVLKKTQAALAQGLTPIVCIGERLEERESGSTEHVLRAQCTHGICSLPPEQFARIVIAYEPVWAIGTGRTATPEIASQAHGIVRHHLSIHFGEAAAQASRILYGGSVKPDNIKGLMAQGDIDGALVGGASLDPDSFAAIVNYA
jgi:triosephosphate isomerase